MDRTSDDYARLPARRLRGETNSNEGFQLRKKKFKPATLHAVTTQPKVRHMKSRNGLLPSYYRRDVIPAGDRGPVSRSWSAATSRARFTTPPERLCRTLRWSRTMMPPALRTPRTSTSAGEYRISNLPAGTYTVTVTATGFSKAELKDVQVELNVTATANITLQVGNSVDDGGSQRQLQRRSIPPRRSFRILSPPSR